MKNFVKHLFIVFFLLAVFIVLWQTFAFFSLIIFPALFLLILIYINHEHNISIPHVSKFLRRQYFKTKFRIHYFGLESKNKKIILSCNRIYLKTLSWLVLILKNSREGFELLRDDVDDFRDKNVSIKEKVLLALEDMEKRIRVGEDVGEKESSELYQELIALHRGKQKNATIFSLFSLAVIIVSTVITSLILNFLTHK